MWPAIFCIANCFIAGLTFAGPAETQENGQPKRQIVVSIPDRKLALIEGGRVVKVYPAAVGAPSTPSPAGQFKIIHRIPRPTYYAPGKVIPAGKVNPLGTRWMGLSLKGFGIHGTNAPRSIGKNRSHGCIRLRNRDAEDLFERIAVGDPVEIHDAVSERVAQIFNHPPASPVKPQATHLPAEMTIASAASPQ